MKTVYACVYQEDAMVAKSMLESAGIPTELLSGGKLDVNPLFNVELSGFTLVVPDDFAEDAAAVIDAFRSGGPEDGEASGKDDEASVPQPALAVSGEPAVLPSGSAIMARSRAVAPEAVAHRRALHAIPEIGLDLPRTVAYVRAALESLGARPRDCGPGLVCDFGTSGPLVAIRADMDALPVTEETGLAWASTIPGAMHACGHDAHAACLLAIARLLSGEPPSGWRARLIFQPGEEGAFGAPRMIEAGCLDGVSAIVGGHLGNLSDELEPGQAGFMPGPMMAAADRFAGSFIGSGGHGSAPSQTLDPIPALAQFIMAVQSFRARRPDQRKPFVLSVCQVEAGSTFNVIPGVASFKGTARTLEPAERELAKTGLLEAARGAAMACGLECRFDWIDGYPPLVNDPACTALAMAAARVAIGADSVKTLTVPSMGGEDFAYYLREVPGCFWFLNTQAPERGITHPNHHPRFDLDEGWMERMIAVNLAAAEALAVNLDAAGAGPASR